MLFANDIQLGEARSQLRTTLHADWFVLILVYPFIKYHVSDFPVFSSTFEATGDDDLHEYLPVWYFLDEVVLFSDLIGPTQDGIFDLVEGVSQFIQRQVPLAE